MNFNCTTPAGTLKEHPSCTLWGIQKDLTSNSCRKDCYWPVVTESTTEVVKNLYFRPPEFKHSFYTASFGTANPSKTRQFGTSPDCIQLRFWCQCCRFVIICIFKQWSFRHFDIGCVLPFSSRDFCTQQPREAFLCQSNFHEITDFLDIKSHQMKLYHAEHHLKWIQG